MELKRSLNLYSIFPSEHLATGALFNGESKFLARDVAGLNLDFNIKNENVTER
jgi:hypothetical protein